MIEWDEHELLHFIDNTSHELSDDGGLLDQDQVRDTLELDVSKHSVDRFLKYCLSLYTIIFLVDTLVVDVPKTIELEFQLLVVLLIWVDPEEEAITLEGDAVVCAVKLVLWFKNFSRVSHLILVRYYYLENL